MDDTKPLFNKGLNKVKFECYPNFHSPKYIFAQKFVAEILRSAFIIPKNHQKAGTNFMILVYK